MFLIDISFARLLVKINAELTFLKIVENNYFQYCYFQFIDLQSKSMDWFIYDRDLHQESVVNRLGV